ncbi:DUF3742 family protein [Halopseudomonas pelagia]|uniref:DUF3742 family protein n=1 Tax=Halopseudomonas pelagia TaxID=553151 RepID=UPI0030D88DD9
MNTITRISKVERFGHWLGRKWRGYMRGERRLSGWLATHGLPAFLSTALVWVVKLAVLAGLLYIAFWLALLLVFAIVAAWTVRNTDWDEEQGTEWRTGSSGFGLYRGDVRIDFGDPYENE